jgi:DNA-binding winged helix-turn-helix (wHTH) protein/TolB-like protein
MSKEAKHVYQFGPFRLDSVERTLHHGQQPVSLTLKAFDVLVLLVRNSGHVLPKDELMNAVWADTAVEESNLSQNIYVLRKALGQNANGKEFIETVPRLGYRFTEPVLEIQPRDRDLALERHTSSHAQVEPIENRESRRAAEHPSIAEARPAPRRSFNPAVFIPKWPRTLWLRVIVATASTVFTSVLLIRMYQPAPVVSSVVVLPFVNATGDAQAEYLSDGIADDVIDDLCCLRGLQLIGRSSAFHFKNSTEDPRQTGKALNVAAVLTGRITRAGGGLILRAELVDVMSGKELWQKRYWRNSGAVAGLHDEISRDLITRFHWGFRLSNPPVRSEAYELYLKNKFYFFKGTLPDMRRAIAYGQQAVEKDPKFAAAYAFLAFSYIFSDCRGKGDCFASEFAAEDLAKQALQLDPGLGVPHVVLAIVKTYRLDWVMAQYEFQRAIELSPTNAIAHASYAFYYLVPHRKYEEAIHEFRVALAQDPYEPVINAHLAWALFCGEKDTEAAQILEKDLQMNPEVPQLYMLLRTIYAFEGRYEEATAIIRKYAPNLPIPQGRLNAEAYWRTELQLSSSDLIRQTYAYAALGKSDDALLILEKSLMQDQGRAARWIRAPFLGGLRLEPRYAQLMRGFRLPR